MKLSELQFEYPSSLVATEPKRPSRVLVVRNNALEETSVDKLLEQFGQNDLLVINDTKVEPRRVFAKSESGEPLEVLFVEPDGDLDWWVMFPSSRLKKNESLIFPDNISGSLVQSGRPQKIRLSQNIGSGYFEQFGEMPLPPYIQKAREQRHESQTDRKWYQTEWAAASGSSAAPTASLHFSKKDFEKIRSRGVTVEMLTLHVGLGTYLPVTTDDLNEHKMHFEEVIIPRSLLESIRNTKLKGGRVWALGTTSARALESLALGYFEPKNQDVLMGRTDLLIQPGFEFKVVDVLLTNFHQPESTLLALVMAFAGRNRVLEAYNFAITNKFRLFSFGDLSVWLKT